MAARDKQWTSNADANGSPIWGPREIKRAANQTNANTLFENQSLNFGGANGTQGARVGVFPVDGNTGGVSSGCHTGWVKRTTGTGRRTGRVQTEVLVAGGIQNGDGAFNIVITSQPSGNTGAHPRTFTVVAQSMNGAALTYEWTWAANDTAIAANSTVLDVNTATLTWNVAATANVIYCLVSDGNANVKTVNVTFTVT